MWLHVRLYEMPRQLEDSPVRLSKTLLGELVYMVDSSALLDKDEPLLAFAGRELEILERLIHIIIVGVFGVVNPERIDAASTGENP